MEDELAAGRIELGANAAIVDLLSALALTNLPSMCYAYKSRVKPNSKLIHKKSIKVKERPDYEIHHITDVVGVRFVSLFRHEMPAIVSEILSLIDHSNPLNPNPFFAGGLEEIILFKGNTASDPLFEKIRKVIQENPIAAEKLEEKNSKEGYSSIHIVARLNKEIDLPRLENSYLIPLEIQVRTVFEDAWGEIDHKYGYVIRTGKHEGEPIHNPASVLAHLKVLKQFSDACADYADVIHKEAIEDLAKPTAAGNVISIEADDETIQRFIDLKIDGNLIEGYVEARKIKTASIESGDSERLYAAAEYFGSLAKERSDSECLFYYYSKMNEAICLLSTGETDEAYRARDIYREIVTQFPNHPLAKHRLAQAYSKLGDIDEAIEHFNLAWLQTTEYEESGSVGGDELPELDYKHILARLPGMLGYSHWEKSERAETAEEKLEFLSAAYEATLPALKTNEESALLQAHNNLLYYSCDKLKYCSEIMDIDPVLEAGRSHMTFLEENQNIDQLENVSRLDTLAQGMFLLGRMESATQIANRIINLVLAGKLDGVDSREALEIAQDARRLLEQIEPG
ncbi:tetratricopeptide repeat protein [Parahaliea mediterranea]|uniref:Tetratricopeptide repeat protein n=1 Tax=Parahaliea mediterranea TaxID=651086 RepID=A0A939DII5_9GAMM|nr:tetratricopeptide repeat protein [Parahaliea mediterranea]MBN7798744.1 tetratricopeptide repeat protein [Parahaliea mediterranea]